VERKCQHQQLIVTSVFIIPVKCCDQQKRGLCWKSIWNSRCAFVWNFNKTSTDVNLCDYNLRLSSNITGTFFETHTSDPFWKARIGECSGSKTSAEIVDYAFVSACWGQLATRPPAFAIISGWTNCASVRDLRFWSFRFVFVAWRLIYELQCFFTKGELQREPMLIKVWEPLLYYMRDSDIDVLSDTIFEQCASWPAEMCNAAFVRNVPEALFHLCKCLVNFYPLVVCNNSISWNLWLKSGHLGEN